MQAVPKLFHTETPAENLRYWKEDSCCTFRIPNRYIRSSLTGLNIDTDIFLTDINLTLSHRTQYRHRYIPNRYKFNPLSQDSL